MLEGSQLTFTPKNLREYDRINKSYENIEDMKALINTEDFYKKVSILIVMNQFMQMPILIVKIALVVKKKKIENYNT